MVKLLERIARHVPDHTETHGDLPLVHIGYEKPGSSSTEVSARTQAEIKDALGKVASESGVISSADSQGAHEAVRHREITVIAESEETPVEVGHPDTEA